MEDDKLLRMQGVAAMLGVSRHTLARIMKGDPTFPRFIELSPGIRMVRRRDVQAWLRRKELQARERTAPFEPSRAN
jgi:predicted DNA-binding transcriptional regulator AlpA